MVDIKVEVRGMQELQRKMEKKAMLQPFNEGLRKIALSLERYIKMATVVKTGRLRASILPELGERGGMTFAKVGTNVKYASFVEYGTWKMEARHMTGRGVTKVLGKGMFTYGLEQLQKKMGDLLKGIGLNIERKFGD